MIKYFSVGFVVLAVMALSACDLYEEGHLTPNRVQVEEEKFMEKIPVAEFNDATTAGLATHYRRHGDGPIDLSVVYDPSSRTSTAMSASTHASRLVSAFRKQGISNVNANILPVNGHGDEAVALVSYTSYNAMAPKDCTVMSGVDSTDIRIDEEYKLGCTVETVFAKQIARPKDLKGQGSDRTTDGRRSNNVVERYRTGVPNEPLEGESSSGG